MSGIVATHSAYGVGFQTKLARLRFALASMLSTVKATGDTIKFEQQQPVNDVLALIRYHSTRRIYEWSKGVLVNTQMERSFSHENCQFLATSYLFPAFTGEGWSHVSAITLHFSRWNGQSDRHGLFWSIRALAMSDYERPINSVKQP